MYTTMTRDRAISVDEARVLALLGWTRNDKEWHKGELTEGSSEWYKDLQHAEATVSACKQVSNALEGALDSLGQLHDGRHIVKLHISQRLSDNEFLLFCDVDDNHDCIFRIQVQGWKP